MNTISEKRIVGLGMQVALSLAVENLQRRGGGEDGIIVLEAHNDFDQLERESLLLSAIVPINGKCRRPELPGDDRQPWMSARLGNKKRSSFKNAGHRNRHAGY